MGDIIWIDGDLRRDDPDVGREAFALGMRAAMDACSLSGQTDPAALRSEADALQTFSIGPWHSGYSRGLRLVADVRAAQAESMNAADRSDRRQERGVRLSGGTLVAVRSCDWNPVHGRAVWQVVWRMPDGEPDTVALCEPEALSFIRTLMQLPRGARPDRINVSWLRA
jgi:hypothetical protein